MTVDEIIKMIQDGITQLKGTTVGYVGHTDKWYENTTTRWYKGLTDLNLAVDALRKIKCTITLSGTPAVGKTIKATITCQ